MTRREADVEFLQLSAGKYSGSTTRVVLGDLRLHWTTQGGETFGRARLDPRFVYFHVPVATDKLIWDGESLEHPTLQQHAGPDEFVRYARHLGVVAMAIPRESVLADAAALAGCHVEELRLPRGAVRESAASRRLLSILLGFADCAANHRARLEQAGYRDGLRTQVQSAVLDHLVEQCVRRDEEVPIPGGRPLRIVRCAEEYLAGVADRRVSVAELCRVTGTSNRTLQYAFRDVYGIPPLRYLLARRFAQAHRALRAAPPESGAVKRAACEAGFTELGRFSVVYRKFFGESPSETLRRT